MPYKFKDDGSHIIKPFARKIYFIIGCLTIARPVVSFILFGQVGIMEYLNIVLGSFMIWGIKKNGIYKILRWYAERKLRKFDNHWR